MTFDWLPPPRRGGRAPARTVALVRRGVHHGHLRPRDGDDAAANAFDLGARIGAGLRDALRTAQPVQLRAVLARRLRPHATRIRGTLALLERLRDGARFQDEIARRIRGTRFTLAGATVDLGDPREIEKVFVDARSPSGRIVARDLFAKLTWIAFDERDVSLRIRFSHGHEALQEWYLDPRLAVWTDRFATAAFRECEAIGDHVELSAFLRRAFRRRVRLSERIVYNNAPGGGAVLHHDAEPTQLGVLFGQLEGRTAWLALPRRELAAEVVAHARATRRRTPRNVGDAMRLLDDPDVPWLRRLLDHTPEFTARLVARGAARVLDAGDALLLPSPSVDDACWHSVFALGETPSLAHSFGIFPTRARGGRDDAPRGVRVDRTA
jgi:hypothetical protein